MSAVDTTCGCGHSVVFHHDQRGCGYFGFGQDRCICKNDPTAAVEQIVQRHVEEAVAAFKAEAVAAIEAEADAAGKEATRQVAAIASAVPGASRKWRDSEGVGRTFRTAARIVRNHPT